MPLYTVTRRDPTLNAGLTLTTPAVLSHFFGPDGEGQRFDLRAELARVDRPVLVLAGAQDPICPLADADDIVEALPPGRVTRIVGQTSGHGLNWDEPELFQNAIRDFLDQVA
jgi:proline iminopeptidase